MSTAEGRALGTIAVTAGRPEAVPGAAMTPPVVLSSTYATTDDRVGYGRWHNPTWLALEAALGELEGGQALVFASGMAAISAVLAQVPPGGRVVAPRHAYSGTLDALRALADDDWLTLHELDIADTAEVEAALPGAALLWVESPTNPMLEVADLPAIARSARRHGVRVAVDNTFATPLLQRPLEAGADVVVHSATKYLSGHSDVLLGAAITRDDAVRERLLAHRTRHGGIAGPMEAWLALRGLRTLHVRVERACANAAELARRLRDHPRVARVRHPSLPDDPGHQRAAAQLAGFGAVISIEVDGGPAAADQVCRAVRLWVPATSLGGVESTLERRRSHASEAVTVPENLVRLSVGIEDVEDLWADLDQALHQG